MPRRPRSRFTLADVVVAALVGALIAVLVTLTASRTPKRTQVTVTVRVGAAGRPIPAGFLGVSLEYPALEPYAGGNPGAIDPVFVQLVRNIAGPAPVLRIGGDSTDWTWWPMTGTSRPPGVTYTLKPRWLGVARRLTGQLHARLILGINLEADSLALARTEVSALTGGLGPTSVRALELGNEPELYGAFPMYHTARGRPVTGRPSSYDLAAFTRDFTRFAPALPGFPLAGPAVSGPRWTRSLGQFLAAEPRVGVATLHRYPLQLCYTARASPHYPTVAHLLADAASAGLADFFKPYAAIVHRRRLSLRVDELNTVSCGADPAVSQTFASALWALDTMFEMVRVGVDGVNIHTFPGAGYELFSFSHAGGRWSATVAPQYYGLVMFAQAAPSGARLLPVQGAPSGGPLKTWATRGPDGRIRVVAINKDGARARVVTIRVPGAGGAASLERLSAPSVRSGSGVTLGAWTFGSRTTTGRLPPSLAPTTVIPQRGGYVVVVPPGSAALLTVR